MDYCEGVSIETVASILWQSAIFADEASVHDRTNQYVAFTREYPSCENYPSPFGAAAECVLARDLRSEIAALEESLERGFGGVFDPVAHIMRGDVAEKIYQLRKQLG